MTQSIRQSAAGKDTIQLQSYRGKCLQLSSVIQLVSDLIRALSVSLKPVVMVVAARRTDCVILWHLW